MVDSKKAGGGFNPFEAFQAGQEGGQKADVGADPQRGRNATHTYCSAICLAVRSGSVRSSKPIGILATAGWLAPARQHHGSTTELLPCKLLAWLALAYFEWSNPSTATHYRLAVGEAQPTL
jgi:hypothetical protein